MDGLFPPLPKDLTKSDDQELIALLAECELAAKKIKEEDAEFLEGLEPQDILDQFKAGAESINLIRAELKAREQAVTDWKDEVAAVAATIEEDEPKAEAEEESGDESDGDSDDGDDAEAKAEEAEVVAEAEEITAEAVVEETKEEAKEPVLVADAAPEVKEEPTPEPKRYRMVPPPSKERIVVNEDTPEPLAFVASGHAGNPAGTKLRTRKEIAKAIAATAKNLGRPSKHAAGREERYLVASLDYQDNFPESRRLDGNLESNSDKIAAIGNPHMGQPAMEALIASGGFCAPFTPIYSMPQLASQARPVRDALPSFRAERGGINVPVPSTVADAAGAITVITAAEDELGGTFATKACLDLTCPDYNETAVTVISHCREFGNLNAFAWPEKISHENEITMAQHARVAEGFLLGQIKAQSVKVSSGAETLSALIYLVDAITKTKFGIRSRLRLPNEARFVALLPRVLLDILELDLVQAQFDRFRTRAEIEGYLSSIGVDVTWYMDTPLLSNGQGTDGPSMIADAAQGDQAALEAFPDTIQWAMFPAGTFLHLDMAELNLGIVRDSTLNSTNDFQNFGETFENVARIGPPQAAYWETTDLCAVGQFPPAGTARTCD